MSRRKTKVDPIEIFFQAGKMYDAHKILYSFAPKQSVMGQSLLVPATILSSFCSELLLKCLFCLDKGYVIEGHNLKTLFDVLTPKTRQAIEQRWNRHADVSRDHWDKAEKKLGVKIERDLLSVLKVQGRTFDVMRYLHEKQDWPYAFHMFQFPDMLGNLIFELKPEWVQKAQDLFNEMQKRGAEAA